MSKLDLRTLAEAMLASGFSIENVVDATGVSTATVYRWVKDFKANPLSMYSIETGKEQEKEQLKKEVRQKLKKDLGEYVYSRMPQETREEMFYLFRTISYLDADVDFGTIARIIGRFYRYMSTDEEMASETMKILSFYIGAFLREELGRFVFKEKRGWGL